jgi:hypothetical protein
MAENIMLRCHFLGKWGLNLLDFNLLLLLATTEDLLTTTEDMLATIEDLLTSSLNLLATT